MQRKNRARCGVSATVAMMLSVAMVPSAMADELSSEQELKLNWNTTVGYGAAWRLRSASPDLLIRPNNDDGDRNFGRGLISNRIDVLTELDARYGPIGARFSAAGWYDQAYNERTDNLGSVGGSFPNQVSTPFDRFTDRTRDLHGRKAEVLDAFISGRFNTPLGPLTMRLGQHALLWGESLFFASNAIAGTQMPFDVSRLLSQPNAQAKEFVLPVPQVSAQWQLNQDVSVGAYYQFDYRPNRLPAVGSYFSQNDLYVDGGERLLLDPALFSGQALRSPDRKPKNSDQFGAQLRWQWGETDLGVYATRFHDKAFQPVTELGLAPTTVPAAACAGAFGPAGVAISGTCFLAGGPTGYHTVYAQGVRALGFSASRTFGDANIALETSIRRGQALSSSHGFDASALGAPVTGPAGTTAFAVGNTAHLNLSALWTLPDTFLWREATFVGELAWNRVLRCKRNCEVATATSGTLDPNASRDAAALRVLLRPTYRQVLPGLDIDVPIGIGYSPKGSRSMALGPGYFPPAGGGDVSIGINGELYGTWRFGLSYTHFFGPTATFLDAGNSYSYKQSLADRNFISFNLRRSF
ncbi:MAG: DUF1302 domain-containing protein [Pigmentiphaga sp.]|uniref:DUF1302 domain-containing protein n=1 Tax=Pigmentiphaga sp. TaxID=1977564 RepID=UPI003B550424